MFVRWFELINGSFHDPLRILDNIYLALNGRMIGRMMKVEPLR